MKKPRVEIIGAKNWNFSSIRPLKFEVKPTKIHGEIFAFLCQLTKKPSVQALEIIRHVDASYYMKKSRWDYLIIY